MPAISTLTDRFDTWDASLWNSWAHPNTAPPVASVVGGQLRIEGNNDWPYVASNSQYDLTGGALSVAMTGSPLTGTHQTIFQIADANSGGLQWVLDVNGASAFVNGAAVGQLWPYSPVAHGSYFRIADLGAAPGGGRIIRWDTSLEGRLWTPRVQAVAPMFLPGAVSVQMRVGWWGSSEATTTVGLFDDLNLSSAADTVPLTAAAQLYDGVGTTPLLLDGYWTGTTILPLTGAVQGTVPPALSASASGAATGTTGTIALPTWQATDYLTLLVASNQQVNLTLTGGTVTPLASAGGRLQAFRVQPTAGGSSLGLTADVSGSLSWWVGAWRNVDPAATLTAANNLGNSTTAPVEVPVVDLGYLASGAEVCLAAASVNATATWGNPQSLLYAPVGGNAALAVGAGQLTAGQLAAAPAAFDRGLDGAARNESALALVLQPVQTRTANLLANGSFESGGAALATGWETEGTAPRLPTVARSTTGVVDGGQAQRFSFTGQAGDSGMVAIYQSPIAVNPGDALTATIYLSGTLTNAYAIFGIEGFVSAGGAYLSEQDTTVLGSDLSSTPRKFTVTYTCPPGCTAVAVYLQTPGLAPSSVVDLYLDRAVLTRG